MKKLKLIIAIFLFTQISFAQERKVFGVVKDSLGLPLPGINIAVRRTNWITQTDLDGKYSIKAKINDVLVFSYIGMETQYVRTLGEGREINVTLKPYDDSNVCLGRKHSLNFIKKPKYVAVNEKDKRKLKRAEKDLKKDLKNKYNPKYNFKKAKNYALINNGYFNIYQRDDCDYRRDEGFQKKYHIFYILPKGFSEEYAKAYNKLVFKHLNEKYKITWQSKIRKDVYGLDEFLKSN